MAFVLLPCDLPSWPKVTKYLRLIRSAECASTVVQNLHNLYDICNVGINNDSFEAPPPDYFASLEIFLQTEIAPDFFSVTLPVMVDLALQLKQLKPLEGLHYSLQQESKTFSLPRNFVAALLAHLFFCTWPRRTPTSHPTLTDPCLALLMSSLHRASQRVKLKSFLNYFHILATHDMEGSITYSRKVMDSSHFVTMEQWCTCSEQLCAFYVHDKGSIQDYSTSPAIANCFTSSDVARPTLTRKNSQQVATMMAFPETLVTAILAERLEDNEAFQISGAFQVAKISDLKTKPTCVLLDTREIPDIVHTLMDADNYSEDESLQYKEINVQRELNKSILGFSQLNHAETEDTDELSSPADFISVSRQNSGVEEDATVAREKLFSSDENNAKQVEGKKKRTHNFCIQGGNKTDFHSNNELLKSTAEKNFSNELDTTEKEKHKTGQSVVNPFINLDIKCVKNKEDRKSILLRTDSDFHDAKSTLKNSHRKKKKRKLKLLSVFGLPAERNFADAGDVRGIEDVRGVEDVCGVDDVRGVKDVRDVELIIRSNDVNSSSIIGLSVKPKMTRHSTKDLLQENTGNDINDKMELLTNNPEIIKSKNIAMNEENPAMKVEMKEEHVDKNISSKNTDYFSVISIDTCERNSKSNEEISETKKNRQFELIDEESKALLDRVLQAIKNIESEKSEQLKQNSANDRKLEEKSASNNLFEKTSQDVRNTEMNKAEVKHATEGQTKNEALAVLHKVNLKPPLPSKSKRPGFLPTVPIALQPQLSSSNEAKPQIGPSQALPIPQIRSELSILPTPDEEVYFSAFESLDLHDGKKQRVYSRRKRNSKIKVNTTRRKSFAQRLKETLARGESFDSAAKTVEQESFDSKESDPLADKSLSNKQGDSAVKRSSNTRKLSGDISFEEEILETFSNRFQKKENINQRIEQSISIDDKVKLKDEDEIAFRSFDNEHDCDMEKSSSNEDDECSDYDDDCSDSDSSRYSFSSDYSSDLNEVYGEIEEILQQLEEGPKGPRSLAIERVSQVLLKRALSESYSGMAFSLDGIPTLAKGTSPSQRSLSLRLQNSLSSDQNYLQQDLANSLKSLLSLTKEKGKRIVTGNWGCGSYKGDPQMKALIQWAAASKGRAPSVEYFSYGKESMAKISEVVKNLQGRGWSVGDLVQSILKFCDKRVEAHKRQQQSLLNDLTHGRYREPSCDLPTIFEFLLDE